MVGSLRFAPAFVTAIVVATTVAACDTPGPAQLPSNGPPVFTSTPVTQAIVGQPYSYTAVASDINNEPLNFSITTGPAWLSLTGATTTSVHVVGTPTAADAGINSVTLSVTDGQAVVTQQFAIQVDTLPTPMVQVTTTADSGPGSLRDAITNATERTVITFAAGVDLITLSSAIDVGRTMRIIGPADSLLTIAGTGADRIFEVSDSASTVEVSGVTLTNGFTQDRGGAVHSHGTLLLRNVRFLTNHAGTAGGAVHSDNDLTVEEVTFESNTTDGDGGAVDVSGALAIANTIFNMNQATGDGGAIRNTGGATLFDVQFIDNVSIGEGAAIANQGGGMAITLGAFVRSHADGDGGALHNSGTVTLSNCLFLDNESHLNGGAIRSTGRLDGSATAFVDNWALGSGGAVSASAAGFMRSSTMFENRAGVAGGGIHAEVAFELKNTVVAGNFTDSSTDPDGSGSITGLGYLMIEDVTGIALIGEATGNQLGVAPGFARMGDGVDFGLVIPDGSPVLDAGSCEGETGDRDGAPRPVDLDGVPNVDDGCDIGAYERQG